LLIIDAHTHLGVYPEFGVKMNVREMIEVMDQYTIRAALVSSIPNDVTLEASRLFPERIYGLVWVNPWKEGARNMVRKAVEGWGFRGVKLHPLLHSYLPNSKVVYPVAEEAVRLDVPILFHCGHPPWSLPWSFEELADTFPDLKIILGHMGHGHIVYINASIEVAKKYDNVYLETSGMPMHTKILEAVRTVGVDRVLYGSDMPFGHPAYELEKVRVAGLRDDELEAVLGLNAKALFNI